MDVISQFLDNIKQKTTNPFIGTLIGVWLVRNWELVYTLFNFDEGCLLADKKKFVWDYYQDKDIWVEFLTNFGYALAFLIIGYVFVIISRIIMNVVYHRIIPFLNSKTVSTLVVDNARFETVKKSRDDYFKKIGELEEERIQLEQKNSLLNSLNIELNQSKKITESDLLTAQNKLIVLEEENKNLKINNDTIINENTKLVGEVRSLTTDLNNLSSDIQKLLFNDKLNFNKDSKRYLTKNLSNENISLNFSENLVNVVSHLKFNNKLEDFIEKAFMIKSGRVDKSRISFKDISYYIENGLMERTLSISENEKSLNNVQYKLSDLGEIVLKYRAVFM